MCYTPIYKCIQCLQIRFLSLRNKWSQPQQHKTRHINYLTVSMDQDWHNLTGSSVQDLKSLHSALLRTEFSSEAQLGIDPLPGYPQVVGRIHLFAAVGFMAASIFKTSDGERVQQDSCYTFVSLSIFYYFCCIPLAGSKSQVLSVIKRRLHKGMNIRRQGLWDPIKVYPPQSDLKNSYRIT